MSNELDLINYFEKRFDVIEKKIDSLMSKEDCENNQKKCNKQTELTRQELSIKKITAIGGVIVGTLTASSACVAIVLKVFFPI